MGVSGSGKTATAQLLAMRLGRPFADADDFHPPANIAKMSAGEPLTDADRAPWLVAVGRWLHDHDQHADGGVIACSALKRSYRDTLRSAAPQAYFVLLTAARELLLQRVSQRRHHFMPASLLDSQLAILQPLQPDERGISLSADQTPNAIATQALDSFASESQ